MDVWVVRAEFGKYARAFREGGYAAIDYSILEPFPVGRGREAYVDAFKKYNSGAKSQEVIGQQVGQITRFSEGMKPGDYVITPSSNTDILFYGKVEDAPYKYVPEPNDQCPFRHRRNIKWSKKTVSRREFSVPFQNTMRSSLTVFGVCRAEEFLGVIGADGFTPTIETPAYNPYQIVLEQILELDAQEFEMLVGHLLAAIGFEETNVTGGTGDGGVDATGDLTASNIAKVRVYVQAKRYAKGTINANTVKKLRASIPSGGQGAFITTSFFQKKAYEIADDPQFPRIGLINGNQLVDLLVEHWNDIPAEFQEKLGLKIGLVKS